MLKSKKSVGLFLMDQAAIAGVGNIYRAEILFKVLLVLLNFYIELSVPLEVCCCLCCSAFELAWPLTVLFSWFSDFFVLMCHWVGS